jgi:anti-anti-sigma factor
MAFVIPDGRTGIRNTAMLRITQTDGHNNAALLRVEGSISGRNVRALRQVCRAARNGSAALVLDLGDVTYIDARGARYLRVLRQRGAVLRNSSTFVQETLKRVPC